MTNVGNRLAERTLELIDLPSVSRDEARIAEHVAGCVPLPLRYRHDDCLLFATERVAGRPLVLLAGHLDTIPAQENLPGRRDGDVVWGLGASDMKGGLAVMIELARWIAEDDPSLGRDLALLFFPREELPAGESALPGVFAGAPLVREADLVVVLEPTDNTIQAGCLGNLNASLVFSGESAHSARPWLGVNAIERAVEGLADVVRLEPRPVTVEGLVFTEVLSVTRIEGGIAANVIPDRVECLLNYRYAPDRTPPEAEVELRSLVGGVGSLELRGNSPPARVAARSPLVQALRRAGDLALEPKQAWTPVAEFAGQGLDAVNLGPGATRFAHRRDEQIAAPELVRTFEALRRFLAGTVSA